MYYLIIPMVILSNHPILSLIYQYHKQYNNLHNRRKFIVRLISEYSIYIQDKYFNIYYVLTNLVYN